MRAAAQVVYPQAQLQPCLRHWLQNLESLLHQRRWLHRRRLRRDFWWIYEAENVEQAERWGLHFLRRWARSEPDFVQQFWEGFDASITFLKSGLRTWSYRLKTIRQPTDGRLFPYLAPLPRSLPRLPQPGALGTRPRTLLARSRTCLTGNPSPNFNTIR